MFFVTSHTHKHIAHTLELGEYFDVYIVHMYIWQAKKKTDEKREKNEKR